MNNSSSPNLIIALGVALVVALMAGVGVLTFTGIVGGTSETVPATVTTDAQRPALASAPAPAEPSGDSDAIQAAPAVMTDDAAANRPATNDGEDLDEEDADAREASVDADQDNTEVDDETTDEDSVDADQDNTEADDETSASSSSDESAPAPNDPVADSSAQASPAAPVESGAHTAPGSPDHQDGADACPEGTVDTGHGCAYIDCIAGFVYNGTECERHCPEGTSLAGSDCVADAVGCNPGYVWNGTTCEVVCPAGSTIVDGNCLKEATDCPEHTVKIGETCVPAPTLPLPTQCTGGLRWTEAGCVPHEIACPSHLVEADGSCSLVTNTEIPDLADAELDPEFRIDDLDDLGLSDIPQGINGGLGL